MPENAIFPQNLLAFVSFLKKVFKNIFESLQKRFLSADFTRPGVIFAEVTQFTQK